MRTDAAVLFPTGVAVRAQDAQRVRKVVGDDPLEKNSAKGVFTRSPVLCSVSIDVVNDEKVRGAFAATNALIAVAFEDGLTKTAIVSCAVGGMARTVRVQPSTDSDAAAIGTLVSTVRFRLVAERKFFKCSDRRAGYTHA